MRAVTLALLTLPIAAFAGCASLPAHHGSGVLTFEEIDRARATDGVRTAYDLVQTLRPRWLEKREPLAATESAALENPRVRVYVNDVSMDGADFLRSIPAETVLELHWLSSTEAAGRYGRTDGLPVIAVTLKR